MTQLQTLLANGKATTPYMRSAFKSETGQFKWRFQAVMNIAAPITPNGNSLLLKALSLKEHIILTAVFTADEDFIESLGISLEKNTFFVEPGNTRIEGDFEVVDKLIKLDDVFGQPTTIHLVESYVPNPYLKEHTPVLNPRSGLPKTVEAFNGQYVPFYRHTELRAIEETPEGNQTIAQFNDKYNKFMATAEVDAMPLFFSKATTASLRKDHAGYMGQLLENPFAQLALNPTVDLLPVDEKAGLQKLLSA